MHYKLPVRALLWKITICPYCLRFLLIIINLCFKVKNARVERPVTVQPALGYHSISSTVFKAARVFWWCSTDVVNKEIATVAHLNVDGPIAAVVIVVEADLPGDFPISYCGMSPV